MDIELSLLQLHLFFILISSSSLSPTPPHPYPPSNHLLYIPLHPPHFPWNGESREEPKSSRRGSQRRRPPGSREEKKKREEKAVAGAVQPHRSHHRRPALIPPVSVTRSRRPKSSAKPEKKDRSPRVSVLQVSGQFFATLPASLGHTKLVQDYRCKAQVDLGGRWTPSALHRRVPVHAGHIGPD